ncbi:hypothetical protein [Phytoactinopolyspora halotolerans]|uniref:Uncharacterized protein n=1 Tax=Phytoactinopolyspora halotolerans TaxID=1981512 RepID=A0A6L9SJT5_9ACTN|nr:hypothetical protein [Phytoactinopolyspora halotolerans]NEE04662.1 hypothetical protein [Phytoactinopolyspora halotolerans]
MRITGWGFASESETVCLSDGRTLLRIQARRDGRLRAETRFALGHHVALTVRCSTWWDWHFGHREGLPALADHVRAAVSRAHPHRAS